MVERVRVRVISRVGGALSCELKAAVQAHRKALASEGK